MKAIEGNLLNQKLSTYAQIKNKQRGSKSHIRICLNKIKDVRRK